MNPRSLLRHVVIALGLTASLFAADPQSKIEDLASWSVLGADKNQLTDEATLSLPAGAQLYRTVSSGGITLAVQSSPAFGLRAADLPVVELGDAALAFLRDGETGKLVLVLGDNPALTLPYEFALAGDGHSQEPLNLTLSRAGATVAVTTRGQTLHFPAGYSARPQEIVLSAGAGQAWPIQGLALTAVTNQDASNARSSDSTSDQGNADQVRQQATKPTATTGAIASESSATSVASSGTAITTAETPPRVITLEVFTPPSVRLGRATEVRKAAMQALQK